jgi:hypothetical protein
MEILHKKGKDNIVVDALSRKDEEAQVFAVSIAIPEWLDENPNRVCQKPRDLFHNQ